MKLYKILLSATMLAAASTAAAQQEVTEYVYQPHWYVQGQFGAQETLGEGPFMKLVSPNAQLAVGYKFNPYIGLRLSVNSWQSRAMSRYTEETYRWKWNYVAPSLDVMFDMTNVLGGYNPTRLVDVNVFGGVGANIGFKNNQAHNAQALYAQRHEDLEMLHYLWDGTKTRFVGQFGADVNFNITQNWAVGLELQANVLNDKYNSKKAGNADWYFNALIGVRYSFGNTYKKVTTRLPEPEPCEPTVIEKVVEKIVEVPVQVPVEENVPELRRDVFFTISNTTISKTEMRKVAEVAEFMQKYPKSHVVVTGYADKGTGTRAINLRLSAQRANTVQKALIDNYKIDPSRITVKSMGDDEHQPYSDPVENRVAICIVSQ